MTNSWIHLREQAQSFKLPESLAERDPLLAKDCGWVEQMRPLILEFSEPGERVLDPFCGFGSTLVAASLEARRSIGIEIESTRCGLARERLRILELSNAKVLEGDCQSLTTNLPCNDLLLTNLPYFACNYDSKQPQQLYQKETYGDYLEKIRSSLKSLSTVLKTGGYAIFAIENIRVGDHFIPQAWDVARLVMARFKLIEERIIVYDKPAQSNASHLSNRAHEYLLIAQNAQSSLDIDAALELLRALQEQFPEAILIGSFARWLLNPSITPSDVDILVPDDHQKLFNLVQWLEDRSFQILRWGAPVSPHAAGIASINAHYLRAERMDRLGQRVVIDLCFAPDSNDYERQSSRKKNVNGLRCALPISDH